MKFQQQEMFPEWLPKFQAKVRKTATCWLWTGAKSEFGYGNVRINKKYLRAHRVSYELANGPIPEDMCVLHRCDTPACVNPDHLFLGTLKDNSHDMWRKGRGNPPAGKRHGSITKPSSVGRGETHSQSRLTRSEVREIRRLSALGKSRVEVGRMFNIVPQHVGRIVRGKAWSE